MKSWPRMLGYLVAIAVVAGAYFIGIGNRMSGGAETATTQPTDPGYAAHDAQVIETGYDGRERYRLDARVIRQQPASGVIELEQLQMDYHPGDQVAIAGESTGGATGESWHLKSDRGQVRDDGDDVQLDGNVVVSGRAPGSDALLSLSTDSMRINTPTEFIETDAPVTVHWSGHELSAHGLQADLKAGTLRLESDVHGEFSPR